MTKRITFIHAADLHLGAPIRGLSALTEEWAARLTQAIPEAFDRVVDAALTREVDFVVLAGDMFDLSRPSYADYLHFFEGLDKLDAAGIQTYLVTGNHDPYTTWARDLERLPKLAHMLGIGLPTFELFERDGEALCLVGGRSFYGQAWPVDENIAAGITRANAIGALSHDHPEAADAPFSVGVIHTGLDIDARKAPVDERFLLAQDIDYWACGHMHRHMTRPAEGNPRIAFPGCVQGRDIKEDGERGCYLVTLEEGAAPSVEFVPTASVALHSLDVNVTECVTLSDVERAVKTALFQANGYDFCSEMVARVNLVGETDLHAHLRQGDVVNSMRRHLNDTCTGFFIDAIADYTRLAGQQQVRVAEGDEPDEALINYVQNTLVQQGIAVPDALCRRIKEFRSLSDALVCDLFDNRADNLDADAARDEVKRRLASYTARDGSSAQSVFYLADRLEDTYLDVRRASEAAVMLQSHDRDLRDLDTGRDEQFERMEQLAGELENLAACCEDLAAVDAGIDERRAELAQLHESIAETSLAEMPNPDLDPSLLELSTQEDRSLRDKLEDIAEERDKLVRAAEAAKERSDASTAAYEALIEVDENRRAKAHKLVSRSLQAVVSVVLPVAFVTAGIEVFIHAREVGSLSLTVLGLTLVVLAFFLAAATIITLFRPSKDDEALEERRQSAHWVMLQEKKLLGARVVERDELASATEAFLEESGLQLAQGSIRQALLLLDDAQAERSRLAEVRQRLMALKMHEESVESSLSELEAQRRGV